MLAVAPIINGDLNVRFSCPYHGRWWCQYCILPGLNSRVKINAKKKKEKRCKIARSKDKKGKK